MFSENCNCGKPGRYTTFKDGEIMQSSCNKYGMCLPYDELLALKDKLDNENRRMKTALNMIVGTNACDYEYRSWAKGALREIN